MQITIEQAQQGDLEELFRIERQCFTKEAFTKEQITGLLTAPGSIGLVCRADGEIAGFIIGIIENYGSFKVGHVYTIDVAIKHRRKGIGTKLLSEMEKALSGMGATNSYLEVRADNQEARMLYQKLGYSEIESIEDYYSPGIHGKRLSKQLK